MSRRRRPRRRDRERWLILLGAALIVLAAVGIAGGLDLLWQARSTQVAIDAETLCPKDGPRSVVVVLIDRTDAITPLQRADIETQLRDLVDDIPRFGALEIYSVGPVEAEPLRPEFKLCNPGRGKEIDPLIGAPERVERRWRSGFEEPLKRVLDGLLQPGTATTSPIMESIQSVAVTAFSGRSREGISKRLVIVSDMIQYTSGLSQYREVTPFATLRKSPYYRKVQARLDGVDVEIWYLRRDAAKNIQTKGHIEFWQEYFSDQGATLSRVLALAG